MGRAMILWTDHTAFSEKIGNNFFPSKRKKYLLDEQKKFILYLTKVM